MNLEPTPQIMTVNNDLRFSEALLCNASSARIEVKVLVGILLAFCVGTICWFALTQNFIAGALCVPSLILPFAFVLGVWSRYRQSSYMQNVTSTITPDNFISRVNTQATETRFAWSRVNWVQNHGQVIILSVDRDPMRTICIPRRCFENSDDANQFFDLSMSYWKQGQVKRHELGKCSPAQANNQRAVRMALCVVAIVTGALMLMQGNDGGNFSAWAFLVVAPIGIYLLQRLGNGDDVVLASSNSLAANQPRIALTKCTNALKRYPGNAKLHVNAAMASITLELIEEALHHCDRAIELDPNNALAFAGRAFALRELGKTDEALAAANHSLQLEPNLDFVLIIRAGLFNELAQYDLALKDCDEAATLNGKGYGSKIARSVSHLCMNDFDSAAKFAQEALTACPDASGRSAVQATTALIHARAGDLEAAQTSLDDSFAAVKDKPWQHVAAAQIECIRKNPTKAIEHLDIAEGLNPSEFLKGQICCDRAIAHLMLGDEETADRLSAEIMTRLRRNIFLCARGAILVRLKRFDEAIPVLDEQLANDRYRAMAYWFRHEAHAALGHAPEADADKQRALDLKYKPYF